MDENRWDKAGSKLSENMLWLPPSSPEAQKRLMPLQKKPLPERMGFSGKAGWDLIQLLVQVIGAFAIPISVIALIVSASQFTAQQQYNAQQALNQEQQTTLETYLDRMSDLLLSGNLSKSKPGDEVRSLARARTLVALQNLNLPRKAILLQFLYESHLIYTSWNDYNGQGAASEDTNPIIDLRGIDLSGIRLFNADLSYVSLDGVYLQGADLSYAVLRGADLSHTVLSGANLSHADLCGNANGGGMSTLSGSSHRGGMSTLSGCPITAILQANLERANLEEAFLAGADLLGSDLEGANLRGADLSLADLFSVDFKSADLWGAVLSDVDLTSAHNLTQLQLDQVKSCKGAILPKGLTCHHNV